MSLIIFNAEILVATTKNADSVHLLALCYFRDGKFKTESITRDYLEHLSCAYIYAQSCLKLGGEAQPGD